MKLVKRIDQIDWFDGFLIIMLILASIISNHLLVENKRLQADVIESQAITAPRNFPRSLVKVTVDDAHDADSFTGTIHLPFGVDLPGRAIRAQGFDAWEVSRVRQTVNVTESEIAKGKRARDEFLELIKTHEVWLEDSGEPGVYGRTSATVWLKTSGGRYLLLSDHAKRNGWERSE